MLEDLSSADSWYIVLCLSNQQKLRGETIYNESTHKVRYIIKILSVNVAYPREVLFNGQIVRTGIFKEPINGESRISLRRLNLDGDRQADLTVHGGPDKAVYAYPSEHYGYWRQQLPYTNLSYGMFGENFTTEGLLEQEVNIGDQFRIGSARIVATQPRMPCYKLGVKFGRMDIIRQFLASGRPGIYFKVSQEGQVGSGDEIELVSRDKNNVTVQDIVRLYVDDKQDTVTMQRATRVKALAKGWKDHFRQQIEQLAK
jgi:MOSC domain-containing protein YiiM